MFRSLYVDRRPSAFVRRDSRPTRFARLLRQAAPGLLASAVVCLVPVTVQADALVLTRAMTATTIAELFIEPDSITLELEIGLPDLPAFANLLPDELYEKMGREAEPLARRLVRFFRGDLVLRSDSGEPLMGRLERMEARPRVVRDEITGQALPGSRDENELVVSCTVVYPLDARPERLTVDPPRNDGGLSNASIGFMVYHRGLPVMDFRYLGASETLRLDWDDPWYSRFDNRNLRRQYDAPLSAFLYIEPYEVRKEVVVRPADLGKWIDLGLDGRDVIPVDEQAEIKRKVAEFLGERGQVTIDGRPVSGTLDRIDFIYRTLRTSGVVDPPRDLDMVSATLGVIFVYPTNALPDEVRLDWDLFAERIERVPAVATDEAGGLPSFLTRDDPVLLWQNFLQNPTIPGLVEIAAPRRGPTLVLALLAALAGIGAVVLVGRYVHTVNRGGKPPLRIPVTAVVLVVALLWTATEAVRAQGVRDEEADAILGGLLQNIYRAFDYRDEGVIYDTLEHSVAGDLLTEIYLETRRSLELENQGGARAKVNDVERVEASHEALRGDSGFVSDYTWNVSGSVGHWGHVHQRRNRYRARVVVRALEGAWKITELEVLQEERL